VANSIVGKEYHLAAPLATVVPFQHKQPQKTQLIALSFRAMQRIKLPTTSAPPKKPLNQLEPTKARLIIPKFFELINLRIPSNNYEHPPNSHNHNQHCLHRSPPNHLLCRPTPLPMR
jgi:hypothetical protein